MKFTKLLSTNDDINLSNYELDDILGHGRRKNTNFFIRLAMLIYCLIVVVCCFIQDKKSDNIFLPVWYLTYLSYYGIIMYLTVIYNN